MLRDDSGNGGGRRLAPRNLFGEPLETCSITPMSGFLSGRLLQHRARRHRQSYSMRRDDFGVSGFLQIARQRSFRHQCRNSAFRV